PVQPQSGADCERAVQSATVQRQHEMQRVYKMGALGEQAIALPQRFPDEIQLSMLEIAQSAMNNARRAAGRAGGDIATLQQQGSRPTASTFAGNGDTVDAAADHYHLEAVSIERRTG